MDNLADSGFRSKDGRPISTYPAVIVSASSVATEKHLAALDGANEFFVGALNSADTFRLLASRVNGILPFHTIELLLLETTRTNLTVAEIQGPHAKDRRGLIIDFNEGEVGQSFRSHNVEFGGQTVKGGENTFPCVEIPLFHGVQVFGVLRLIFNSSFDAREIAPGLFEAIGARAAPLILGSIVFEQNRANALTDFTTDLPNERALYMVLENQIAESMHNRDERPLSVLAIDIKNFNDINHKFGHIAGDTVLNFAARGIKENLREMDFLARSTGDEFLVTLPTASAAISHEIIQRIQTGFRDKKIILGEQESIEIELNVGWASFGNDGETPGQLLSLARLRKAQSKSVEPNNVLWFPQEISN